MCTLGYALPAFKNLLTKILSFFAARCAHLSLTHQHGVNVSATHAAIVECFKWWCMCSYISPLKGCSYWNSLPRGYNGIPILHSFINIWINGCHIRRNRTIKYNVIKFPWDNSSSLWILSYALKLFLWYLIYGI